MANYSSLLAAVNAAITANGTGAITGPVLNTVLQQMIVSLGQGGYIFKGRAIPTTDPGSPDQNVFYIATTPGTYTNFSSIVVAAGECAILKGSGTSWSKEATGIDLVSVSQNTLTTDNKAKAINVGGTDYNITDADAQEKISQLGQNLAVIWIKNPYSENISFLKLNECVTSIRCNSRIPSNLKLNVFNGRAAYNDIQILIADANGNVVSNLYADNIDFTSATPVKLTSQNTDTYIFDIYIIPNKIYTESSFVDISSYSILLNDVYINGLQSVEEQIGQVVDNLAVIWIKNPFSENISFLKLNECVTSIRCNSRIPSNLKLMLFNGRTTYNDVQVVVTDANGSAVSELYKDGIDFTSDTPVKLTSQNTDTYKFDIYIIPSEIYTTESSFVDISSYSILLNDVYINGLQSVEEKTNIELSALDAKFNLCAQNNGEYNWIKSPYYNNISLLKLNKTIVSIAPKNFIPDGIKLVCFSARIAQHDINIEFKNENNTTVSSFYTDEISLSEDKPVRIGTSGTYSFVIYFIPNQIDTGGFRDLSGYSLLLNTGYLNNLVTQKNNFVCGEDIVCFGDSITMFEGTIDSKTYADWMNELYGINTLNCGFGGTQITSRTTPVATPTTSAEAVAAFDIVNLIGFICNNDYSKLDAALAYIVAHDSEWISTRYTRNLNRLKSVDWSNIKAVTFFAGTNDFSENVPIGNDNDDVATTIKGAMNIITSTLLQTYPHLKVYWFTPIVRYTASERTDANWCDNSNLPNYVQAIKDQSAKLKLPVCDLYHTLGWNQYNFSQYFISTDNVHPYTGFKEIAIKISKFINAN